MHVTFKDLTVFVLMVFFHYINGKERLGASILKGSHIKRVEFNQTFPGCWLGNRFYMVGDKWSPKIEPHGVMDCVKCQCAQVVEKSVVQLEGKVLCQNIKRECPKVSCIKPRLRPHTCCRICQDKDALFEDQFRDADVGTVHTSETGQLHGLFALLTGSMTRSHHPVKTKAVSYIRVNKITGNRFNYYIRFSRLKSPLSLLFEDERGRILIEVKLDVETQRKGKIEGEVRDVPSRTMSLITQGDTWCSITTTTHRDGEISGRLTVDPITTQALFEAVLSPTTNSGNGGYMAFYYDGMTSQMSYMTLLHDNDDTKTGLDYYVTIEKDTEIIYKHLLRLSEHKLIGRLRLDRQMSKQIARGRLNGRVTSRNGETVTGVIRPRLVRSDVMASLTVKDHNITGYMVCRLQENGALAYKLWIDGRTDVHSIAIQRPRKNKRKWKTFIKLNHEERMQNENDAITITGEYRKLKVDETAAILHEEVRIQLATDDATTYSYFQHRRANNVDLIADSSLTVRSQFCEAMITVWYKLATTDCAVHLYIERLSRYKTTNKLSITLSTHSETKYRGESQEFRITTELPEVTIFNMSTAILNVLNDDGAVLHVYTDNTPCEVWTTPLHIANNCWRPVDIDTSLNELERNEKIQYTCHHEGRFYPHGDTWIPDRSDNCVTCRCQRGSTHCDDVLCPTTNCEHPVKTHGECCSVCEEDNETEQKPVGSCYYHGDKRWHSFGTFWHPYVPPFGYSKCSICTCMPDTGDVNCTRLPCPILECPLYQRVRTNREDCCQTCQGQATENEVHIKTYSETENCQFGASTYSHGDKWHPVLTPFGKMTCYICSCKNGKIRCRKKRCPSLKCSRQFRPAGQCCPLCIGTKTKRRNRRKHWTTSRRSRQ